MVCAWKFRVEVGEEVGPEEYFNYKMRGNGGHREININYR